MPKNKLNKKSHTYFKIIGVLLITIFVLVLIALGYGFNKYRMYVDDSPRLNIQNLKSDNNSQSKILSDDNKIIWKGNNKDRLTANYEEIPSNLKDALYSIEDREFETEGGINIKRIISAACSNLLRGNKNQGGSTLTQQLIKNTYFTNSNDKSWKRKAQEAHLAINLNKKASKQEILTMYINKVYMGLDNYGMKTAAKYYFNKGLYDLTINESALLAGLVQSPTNYEPYNHIQNATWRRNIVLKAMYENKKISYEVYQQSAKKPIEDELVPLKDKEEKNNNYYRNQLIADPYTSSVIKQLKENKINIDGSSIEVKTPLNFKFQKKLQNIIKNDHSIKWPNKQLQVGATVIDNSNGNVVAQVGDRNQKKLGGFNRATSELRSSGSTIKPLIDYAPAFDDLHYGTGTTVQDTAYKYPNSDVKVNNWDNKYMGNITIDKALSASRNIPAIKTLEQVGLQRANQTFVLAGFKQQNYYSNGIGVNVSPAQLASGFSSLANNGQRYNMKYYNYAQENSKIKKQKNKKNKVMTPESAFMLNSILKKVPQKHQLGENAYISNLNQAGKTGTIGYDNKKNMPNDAITDAWYAGYTKKYTIAVWTGYDDPMNTKQYLTQKDSSISQLIYKQMMSYIMKNEKNVDWKKPNGLISYKDIDGNTQYKWKNNKTISSPGLENKLSLQDQDNENHYDDIGNNSDLITNGDGK